MEIQICPIWGDLYPARGRSYPEPSKVVVDYSARTDGGYILPGSVCRRLAELNDSEKARLTTWLIDQRLQGVQTPTVTDEIIAYAGSKQPLPVYERAYRLLRFIAGHTSSAADFLSLYEYDDAGQFPVNEFGHRTYPQSPTNPNLFSAMAWSESTSVKEVWYFFDYLEEVGWVRDFPSYGTAISCDR